MNKRAFSVGYRKPVIVESSDPRNNGINRYISKLGREAVLKNLEGNRKLASASLLAWNPELPQTATLTPSTQNAIGETESYLTTSTFTPSSEFVGPISYSISGEENLPSGLNFNTSTGVVSGTPTIQLSQNAFTITGTDSFGTFANSILNLLILLKAAILPSTQIIYGEVDSPLSSIAFTPNSRFVGAVTYSISGGTLPAGLSFNTSTGVISGTPTETLSQTNFTVTASGVDAYSTSVSADADILLSVLVKAEITPATQTLLAVINEEIAPTTAYTPNSRFDGIVTYALSGGVLPVGLSFDTSTGVISGTPLSGLEETEFLVTASGVDIYDQNVSATATIDITVFDAPEITPETQEIMTLVNVAITPTIAYTPNIVFNGTVTYTLIPPAGRSLPTGLSFDTSTGVISGTPTTTLGTTDFTVQADDAFGNSATATITITVTSTVLVVGPEIINTPGLTDSASTTLLNVGTISITDSIITPSESDAVLLENINILSATASDSITVNQETDSAIAESLSIVDASVSDNISYTSINDSSSSTLLSLPSGIVADGLVLSLDASNSSSYPGSGTNWFDISYNSKHATLINGPTYSSSNSGILVFDGNNDYAEINSPSPLSGTKLFTFEIWVNFTSITGDFGGIYKGAFLFAGGTSGGAGQPEFAILSANNSSFTPDTLYFGRGAGGTSGSLSVNVSSLISNGNWYQIVLTRESSNSQKVYLNGSEIGTGTVSNSFNDGNTHFGAIGTGNPNYDAFLNGNIGNINIYNRALTASEVQSNFNGIKTRYGL